MSAFIQERMARLALFNS